jgi:hypothetical protein
VSGLFLFFSPAMSPLCCPICLPLFLFSSSDLPCQRC